jgi:hypothetical protein
MSTALFFLGQTASTPGALDALSKEELSPWALLTRHATGDWGDLGDDDKQLNQDALVDKDRIFSAYILPKTQQKLFVITEADRSRTTLLLPEEY